MSTAFLGEGNGTHQLKILSEETLEDGRIFRKCVYGNLKINLTSNRPSESAITNFAKQVNEIAEKHVTSQEFGTKTSA